ncbi:endonuclease/exonuclease/phosphatase family protein [Alistipes sp.]|uniref:endonuclease/exonuclease/phosphatase family protein n=1 Tax=Alistipes sp. TaxID=1872444 RepID=UPI0025B8C0B5|nr:endonuclease/exonuclease/phosphatase family protein [Alistipes sp.]
MKKTIFFLLLTFCFSNSVQANQDTESIKLISFNMRTSWGRDGDNSWPNRCHATTQMLRQEAPDVMGVQEAMQDQLYYIDTECPRYARVGEDRDGGAEGGETMAVFYLRDRFDLLDSGTFWISETPDKVSRGWDAACNRTVTWVKLRDRRSDKEFFYFNTHLDHQGEIAREEGAKLIAMKIRQITGKKATVILGGDLNTYIENKQLKPITKLMASVRDTAAETDHKGTFNGFGSAPDTIILDHLFCRGRIKCLKFATLDGDYGVPYISDHYPIAMVFTLRK